MSRVNQMKNPTDKSEWGCFEGMIVLFQKYGEKYNFDLLLLDAQEVARKVREHIAPGKSQ